MNDEKDKMKKRLIAVLRYLIDCSDEQHPKTTSDIVEYLQENGFSADRRTVYDAVETFNNYGFDVDDIPVGRENGYYIIRPFENWELCLLIDLIQSTRFLTIKKTEEITEKLATLGGKNYKTLLTKQLARAQKLKHSNNHIAYNIDTLKEAIFKNAKVRFKYFKYALNSRGNRIKHYEEGGNELTVEPISMTVSNGNYYLICYHEKFNAGRNYRVDRMESVRLVEKKRGQKGYNKDDPENNIVRVSPRAKYDSNEITDIVTQSFKMYSGQSCEVTLRFNKKHINSVYDNFGEGISIKRTANPDIYETTVNVMDTPTFYGWLFQYAGDIQVAGPKKIADEFKRRAQLAAKNIIFPE